MSIYQLGDNCPDVDPSAYITDNATVIGNVKIEANASIWFGVSIRGDNDLITVGRGSNVQENSVLHTDHGYPLSIGENVTIGHMVMLHGCTIGEGTLIGIQAVILNGAKIGKNSLVGAGALVTEGKEFPDNVLIIGTPAKVARLLTEQELAMLAGAAQTYAKRAQEYKTQLKKIG